MKDIADTNILLKSFDRAIKNAKWKSSCQKAEHDVLTLVSDLQESMLNGEYKSDKLQTFIINERGKTRAINGNSIKDRTLRHALCDEILMPAVERKVIYDNSASQNDKGVDFARRRLKCHLQRYYRKYGNDGYVLLIDFSRYYDNIRHDIAYEQLNEFIEDDLTRNLLKDIFNSFKPDVSYLTDEEFKHSMEMKFNSVEHAKRFNGEGKKFLDKSVPIGDQTSQIIGIYYPHQIDKYIKIVKGIKYYGRYMDDVYIISHSKEELEELLIEIREIAESLGMYINEKKTHIYRINKPFHFLQSIYYLTDSGRVVEKISKKRVVRMRRKLKKLKVKVDNGEAEYSDVENMFHSWIIGYKKVMSKKQIENMYLLFNSLFGKELAW